MTFKQDEFAVVDFQQQNNICNKKAVDQKRRRVQVCWREFENL